MANIKYELDYSDYNPTLQAACLQYKALFNNIEIIESNYSGNLAPLVSLLLAYRKIINTTVDIRCITNNENIVYNLALESYKYLKENGPALNNLFVPSLHMFVNTLIIYNLELTNSKILLPSFAMSIELLNNHNTTYPYFFTSKYILERISSNVLDTDTNVIFELKFLQNDRDSFENYITEKYLP